MNELALFSGAGGGILGGRLLGWRTVCAVEHKAYAASVLVARQNDGLLRPFPIWDDVRTFDGRTWAPFVDVVSGGFPCQDISPAGQGAGIEGEQSGLWVEMARIVREVEPGYVYVENSPSLTSRGLGRVLGDLAALGFDARWGVLGAHHADARHERERIWILADHPRQRQRARRQRRLAAGRARQHERSLQEVPDAAGERFAEAWEFQPGREAERSGRRYPLGKPWPAEPKLGRVADGVAHWVDRIAAIGNGQVPRVAAAAWTILSEGTPS